MTSFAERPLHAVTTPTSRQVAVLSQGIMRITLNPTQEFGNLHPQEDSYAKRQAGPLEITRNERHHVREFPSFC